jgi:hypothetical protein
MPEYMVQKMAHGEDAVTYCRKERKHVPGQRAAFTQAALKAFKAGHPDLSFDQIEKGQLLVEPNAPDGAREI